MSVGLPPRVLKARLQLMLHHPFLATAVAQLPLVNAEAMDWCKTMATDGYFIYVNPIFCEKQRDAHLQFIFAHEVLHCVLGHIDRRQDRDRKLWNIAIDYATNGLLVQVGFAQPQNGLYNPFFNAMTAEGIYENLKNTADQKRLRNGETQTDEDLELSYKVSNGKEGETEGSEEDLREKQDQQSTNRRFMVEMGKAPNGFDIHVEQTDSAGAEVRTGKFPTTEERKRLRLKLSRELVNKLPGKEAGRWLSEVEAATESQVSWEQLLAHFMSGIRRSDYRLFPFNKKHLYRGIYLPSLGVPGPDHIVVAVDTSGSMSDQVLSRILKEIDQLRSVTECLITVIQCDAEIQKVERFEAFESPAVTRSGVFVGRGGTDLCKPFQWIENQYKEEGMVLDALIYMTDGYGQTPKNAPNYPVLWIMPKDNHLKPDFGSIIEIA